MGALVRHIHGHIGACIWTKEGEHERHMTKLQLIKGIYHSSRACLVEAKSEALFG